MPRKLKIVSSLRYLRLGFDLERIIKRFVQTARTRGRRQAAHGNGLITDEYPVITDGWE